MNQPGPEKAAAIAATSESELFPSSPGHDAPPVQSPASSVNAIAKARDLEELERIRRAVLAVGDAAYHWDITTDKMVWSSNVSDVIPTTDPMQIKTGRSYADLLDASNLTSRYDTVMRSAPRDPGDGVPFSIEYLIHPTSHVGQQSLWIEDCGRWYCGQDGKPAEVFGIVRQIDDRHERDQQLQFMGNCDPLTGMMNRGRLSEALAETMAKAEDENTSCAFLIVVINNLAVVNDAYGFDIADEVIVSVGHRLKRVVRTGDMIGRYSGAKFGVILSDCTEGEVKIAAERFLSVARDNVFETERGPVWAMLSIGGIVLPKFAGDANAAMANAEEALAEAKRQPSDAYVPYRPSAERISVRSLNARCAAEIVSSLKNNRFTLAYQPIVDARTGEIAMHEALLRMRCEDGDTVAAHHLIPIAEKLGLVRMIDRAVARLAVDTLALNPELSISVNISGITATDRRWFSQLTAILSETPGISDRIVVEITESVALQDLGETIRFTRELRQLGCRVAIDDFGAGYTSFKNLRELDIDIVKIDGSFCEHLTQNRDNQYFVRSLIDLAKKFELQTVAEWVRSEEDADLLRSWGIDYMQGNLFGEVVTDVTWELPERDGADNEPEQVEAFDASLISAALQEQQDNAANPPAPQQDWPEDAEQPFDSSWNEPQTTPENAESSEPNTDATKSDRSPLWSGPQSEPAPEALVILPTMNTLDEAQTEETLTEPQGNTSHKAEEPIDSTNPTKAEAGETTTNDGADAVGMTDQTGSADDFEPIDIKLNLSLLQTAKSGLDATFGPPAKESSDKHPDLASAITETFGEN